MATDLITVFDSALRSRVEAQQFIPLGPGSERHGSWEWRFLRKADGLNRFVRVALTPMPAILGGEPWYAGEVWAGADDGSRFVRLPIAEFRASESQLLKMPEALVEGISRAMRIARELKPIDLREIYSPASLK